MSNLNDGCTRVQVWASAHILAEHIATCPELVRGRRVLELGSGCGLTGILAAKLGAAQVLAYPPSFVHACPFTSWRASTSVTKLCNLHGLTALLPGDR